MSRKLFVGNLSFETGDADLKELFSRSGRCESASVVRDRATGRSRGFGFVEMSSDDEAHGAIAQLDGSELQGRTISVSEARERSGGRTGRGSWPPRGFDHRPSSPGPRFRKSRGSRRGLRGKRRSL
ncbi:MAG: RNA recognition motif domain-containing protein [Acidobacteriota bacterium]